MMTLDITEFFSKPFSDFRSRACVFDRGIELSDNVGRITLKCRAVPQNCDDLADFVGLFRKLGNNVELVVCGLDNIFELEKVRRLSYRMNFTFYVEYDDSNLELLVRRNFLKILKNFNFKMVFNMGKNAPSSSSIGNFIRFIVWLIENGRNIHESIVFSEEFRNVVYRDSISNLMEDVDFLRNDI